ncbi:hypothetical protein AB0B25_15980 [Nocardia sp. NPDC049190]|uniref:Rv1733c family protein n=1 Tax=Nocardia sp. NPDC049190 TaxID=3155650 RepID=UPI00340BE7C5
MSDTETIPILGWLTRLARLWSRRPWSSNPLLRTSDRWEGAVIAVVVLAALIAVPIAGALGTRTYIEVAARIRVENVTKSAVTAVITDEPVQIGPYHIEATTQWNQNGRPGDARLPVRRGARPGDHVTVWIGPDGAPTTEPRDGDDAAMAGIGAGVVALAGTWLCGWCLVTGVGWLLDRRRSAAWASEWRQMSRPVREDRPW